LIVGTAAPFRQHHSLLNSEKWKPHWFQETYRRNSAFSTGVLPRFQDTLKCKTTVSLLPMPFDVPDDFQMVAICLQCDTDLRNTFRRVRIFIFIKSFYLLVSFQCLVTMCGEWRAFSEVRMFVNSSFENESAQE
jgi:hypothetical protein